MKDYVKTDPLERWYIRRDKRNAKLGVIIRWSVVIYALDWIVKLLLR